VGIPKGSLEDRTIELFRKSGWKIGIDDRSYFPSMDDEEAQCTLVRAQEMSRFVEMGTLDVGLTGRDWILENGSDVVVVRDLVYSKVSQRPAKWVLVVAEDSPIRRLEDLRGKKIFTELTNFTRKFFSDRNQLHAEVLLGPEYPRPCGVFVGGYRGKGYRGVGRRHC
jgi:ATP phosphoribosyltransferase